MLSRPAARAAARALRAQCEPRPWRPAAPQTAPHLGRQRAWFSTPTPCPAAASPELAKKAFEHLDTNKNGYLSGKELAAAVTAVGLPEAVADVLLRRCAHNPSEGATFDEFSQFCGTFCELWAKQGSAALSPQRQRDLVVQLVFRTFDKANNGYIDAEELTQLLEVVFGPELQESGMAGSRIKTREAAALLLQEYDLDKDKHLNLGDVHRLLDDQHAKVTEILGHKPPLSLVLRCTVFTAVDALLRPFTQNLAPDPAKMET